MVLQSQKTQTPDEPVIYATFTPVPPTPSPTIIPTPTEAQKRNKEMLQRAGEIYREKKERDVRATAIAEGAIVTITGLVIPATATPTASVYIGGTPQAPSQNDYAPPYLMSFEENKLVEQIVIEHILRNCHKNSFYATNLEWVSSEGLILNPNTNTHVRVGEMAFDRAEPQFFPKWAVEIGTSNVTYLSEPTNAGGRDYSTAYQYKTFCKDSYLEPTD